MFATVFFLIQPDTIQQLIVEIEYSFYLSASFSSIGQLWHGGPRAAGGPDGLRRTHSSFIIWNDHKNITYLKVAKQLNSRQARWALFFAWLNFLITYRPSSWNIKNNDLSHLFSSSDTMLEKTTMLLPSCIHWFAVLGDWVTCLQYAAGQTLPQPFVCTIFSSVPSHPLGTNCQIHMPFLVKTEIFLFFIAYSGGLHSLKISVNMCQPVKYIPRINLSLLRPQESSDCYLLQSSLGPI